MPQTKPQIKEKIIKAWAVVDKNGIRTVAINCVECSKPFAIYKEGAEFNKGILKMYKCKVVPVEIKLCPPKRK